MNKITKCPECGSKRITRRETYDCFVERNMQTGKIFYREQKPEKWGDCTLWLFECRTCGWMSDAWDEERRRKEACEND